MSDTITKEQAKQLAVAYALYCSADRGRSTMDIINGARILEPIQKSTGVILVNQSFLRCMIPNEE